MASPKLELQKCFFRLVSEAFELIDKATSVDDTLIQFPKIFDAASRECFVACSFLRVIAAYEKGQVLSMLDLQEFSGFPRFDEALLFSGFVTFGDKWEWHCDLKLARLVAVEILLERLSALGDAFSAQKHHRSLAERQLKQRTIAALRKSESKGSK